MSSWWRWSVQKLALDVSGGSGNSTCSQRSSDPRWPAWTFCCHIDGMTRLKGRRVTATWTRPGSRSETIRRIAASSAWAKYSLLTTRRDAVARSTSRTNARHSRIGGGRSEYEDGCAVTARTALTGLRYEPAGWTPWATIAARASHMAAWSAVVPVLCGPMCRRRVPSGRLGTASSGSGDATDVIGGPATTGSSAGSPSSASAPRRAGAGRSPWRRASRARARASPCWGPSRRRARSRLR